MKISIPKYLVIALAALVSGLSVKADQTLSYAQTVDNGIWPSVPSGYPPNTSVAYIQGPNASLNQPLSNGYYDAFNINVSGTPNATVSPITMGFHFGGYFDDSVALDLNGDGTIDYAISWYDMQNAYIGAFGGGYYQPWSSLQDAGNLGIILNITSSGTTADAYLYGRNISLNDLGSLNNLSSITLSSLGLGTLDGNGNATSTSAARIGFLNVGGGTPGESAGGGGLPDFGAGSFNYSPTTVYSGEIGSNAVPEPSTYALFGLGALCLVIAAQRRCA